MNRKQRRQAASGKRSKNATPDEIMPEQKIRPIESYTQRLMTEIMNGIVVRLPGYHVTLFIAEHADTPGAKGPPFAFNYMSNADREDMCAVLRAFIAKQDAMADQIDRFAEAPPTETRQ